ncbi:subtilisin-like serine protease [Chytridiales sp. JEL 0842]|nr:subtilisin-like serine protease [Chytridiales sp. JEL 0842]
MQSMSIYAIFAFALLTFAQHAIAAPSLIQKPDAHIPNQYIVVFKSSVDPKSVAVHQAWLESAARLGDQAPQYKRLDGLSFPDLKRYDNFDFLHKYSSSQRRGFRGYAARISESIAESLRQLPEVAFVEQDTIVSIDQVDNPIQQAEEPWGLRRLSKPDLPLPEAYTFNEAAGEGVDVYVIDSGALVSHPEFEGRAIAGPDFSSEKNGTDMNGHGTHVAGIIAGKTYGVAKKANIIAVKVFPASGSGPRSNTIAGINWAVEQASRSGRPSIISMSLSGVGNNSTDGAISSAIAIGITVVSAAGNNGFQDSCYLSPARMPSVITVAAFDINDTIASFSNIGPCVKIFAPGVDILSTWNNGGTRSISGTSMATPHISGVVAVGMSAGKITTPASALAYLISTGVKDKIAGVTNSTVNLLAQVEL